MKNYKKILPYIILAELVSLSGFLVPEINALAFFAIIALTLVAAMVSLELGLLILFTELFIGSKGQLFFFEAGGVLVSIRIALWLIIMSVWAGKFLNLYFKKEIDKRKIKKLFASNKLFLCFNVLMFFVLWGVISGFLNNNTFNNIFFDANGWLYLLLIFPVFTLPLVEPKFSYKKFKDNLFAVFMAGIIWLSIKTLILLYFFSHNIIGVVEPLYRWVRVSGVGEITNMDSGFTRIFFQSHIFVLIGIFIVLAQSLKVKLNFKEKKVYWFIGLLSLLLATTIVSFSRSNWLGLMVGFLFFYFFIFLFYNLRASCHCEAENNPVIARSEASWQSRDKSFYHGIATAFGLAMTGLFTRLLRRFTPRNDRKILQTTIIIFLSTIFSLILIAGIIKFPLPTPGTGFSASLIQNRAMQISGEAGVSSRWALLPELLKEIKKTPILGAGFGATVSYRTSDPRVLEQNPNGQYTTYAFEWGFLDIWLKLGLLGLSAYLALIIMIFVVAFKRIKKQNISACHSDPPAGGEESRGCRDEILRPPSSRERRGPQDDTVVGGLLLGLIVISVVSFFSPYLNHPLGIGYLILVGFLVNNKK